MTDHKASRNWAEQHGGKPAAVDARTKERMSGLSGSCSSKAPHSEHSHLVEISWDEFFKEFEERQLALLCDPQSPFS